jgi:hypothetical protein
MSKLREIIRDERQRRQGLARGPFVVMTTFWEPILSPTGSVVGKRKIGASATIVGDPHRRIWEQHGDESFEAFKERLAKARADVARTQGVSPTGR